ncbi:MAG TPA: MMPL family transporter, partial [Gaiellaceae bacterium]|nr:MMPL family transporter [Gaiellaceae bacterium]
HPEFYVDELGSVSTNKATDAAFNSMLAKAGLISIPLTLVILLLVFGSLTAALIPLMLALTAIFATMGLIAFPSSIIPMEETVSEVILLIGLAVGVDYSLFYVKREREERRAGRSERAALEAAAATSGRAVLISGITVMIAMAGMFFSGDKTFMSFAIGPMMVVAVAMLGSLTVLPAMLSWLGDRVDKVRVPLIWRLRRDDGQGRVWGAILDHVLRRPVVSVAAATAVLVALPSQIVPMDESIAEVILLIGLAVGVDYSLFYIRRERDERRAGRSESAALEAAAATSGRAVLIAGVTVMIAMAGMFFSGDKTFMSFAIGTMLVVAVAMLGSLTVLPAMLAWLGDRIDKVRVPFVGRRRGESGESRVWSAILDRVLRRPVLSAAAATATLVALAMPALTLNTSISGVDALPASLKELQSYHRINDAFPGGATPAVVAIAGDASAPELKKAIAELRAQALASGAGLEPIHVEIAPGGKAVQVQIPLVGKGTDAGSNKALATLREDIIPATLGTVPGIEYAVTGDTAASKDWNDAMKSAVPIVFGFVLLFAFVLLLVTFRSVVIPLKAILMNLLSVAAAYGVVVALFQWGWGESLFDFESNGGIAAWLPMFLFVILFGLSMDYHVFILSRVREYYDRGLDTEHAVAKGIKSTAGVVTSAAVVMVLVFGVFALMPLLDMKEMGIGLAAAILIDATIVRAVLLPATMKLLGKWNWYLPTWLAWLPSLEHERTPEPAPQQA